MQEYRCKDSGFAWKRFGVEKVSLHSVQDANIEQFSKRTKETEDELYARVALARSSTLAVELQQSVAQNLQAALSETVPKEQRKLELGSIAGSPYSTCFRSLRDVFSSVSGIDFENPQAEWKKSFGFHYERLHRIKGNNAPLKQENAKKRTFRYVLEEIHVPSWSNRINRSLAARKYPHPVVFEESAQESLASESSGFVAPDMLAIRQSPIHVGHALLIWSHQYRDSACFGLHSLCAMKTKRFCTILENFCPWSS